MVYRGKDAISALAMILAGADWPIIKDHGANFFRVGAGFDIETTSVVKWHYSTHGLKKYDFVGAFAYHMQFSLGPDVLLLRTWEDTMKCMNMLREYGKKKKARFLIWIANLGYEFQFLRKRMEINTVFATKLRQPLYFRSGKLEFRDCLQLTGGGLAYLAKHYTTTQKMVGDLDYSIPRNSSTPLTPEEELYCINDVVILSEFTDYCLKQYTDRGQNIPYTATGIPRAMVKGIIGETDERKKKVLNFIHTRMCIHSEKRYKAFMSHLFRGGFTHANAWNINQEFHDVYGVDLTSSYPAVMLQSKKYPMNQFTECRIQTDGTKITQSLDDKCYVFKATFFNIRASTSHCLESKSKIISEDYHNMIFDNGRLYKGAEVTVMLTEFDYKNYCMFYEWDYIDIPFSMSAPCGALPPWLLDPLRALYRRKEILKAAGADDSKHPSNSEYKILKGQINSFYGMCCTRLKFLNDSYNIEKQEWELTPNKKKYAHMVRDTFLSPYWGIYISAMARHRLCVAIHAIDSTKDKNDVIYYDTDSIYFIGRHNLRHIERFNENIDRLNTDFKGLGCFDLIKGTPFRRFKTIGAKRYIKEHSDGRIDCVVAGLDGDAYVRKFKDKCFEEFSLYGFKLDSCESLKTISIYCDDEQSYKINGEMMTELSSVCICESDFELNFNALQNIRNFIINYCQGV